MNKKEITRCAKGCKDDIEYAVALWSQGDVIARAADRAIVLSISQAQEIIGTIHHEQDRNIGITWSIIDYYTDKIKRK